MTDDETAMIAFNYAKDGYRRDGMRGAEVAIFRNEGSHKSSELIKEAIQIARQAWGVESFFTYVDPSRVNSKNPGYCFKAAGFKHTHTTPKGLHLLTLIFTTPSP